MEKQDVPDLSVPIFERTGLTAGEKVVLDEIKRRATEEYTRAAQHLDAILKKGPDTHSVSFPLADGRQFYFIWEGMLRDEDFNWIIQVLTKLYRGGAMSDEPNGDEKKTQ